MGDPDKAMNAVVDVVRGEGKAQGKPWPLYLVLGDDAERDITRKLTTVSQALDEWKEVTRSTSFDDCDHDCLLSMGTTNSR